MEMTTYETLALFYETSTTLDRFFDFWLTATFAVIVAVHMGKETITRAYANVIIALYLAFTVSILARQAAFSGFMASLRDRMDRSPDVPDIAGLIPIIDGSLLVTMGLGTASAVYFVWRCGYPLRDSRG